MTYKATKREILDHLHVLESRMVRLTVVELNERRDCEIALGMTDANHDSIVRAAARVSAAIQAAKATRRSIAGRPQPRSSSVKAVRCEILLSPELASAIEAETTRLQITRSAWLTGIAEAALGLGPTGDPGWQEKVLRRLGLKPGE